MKKTISYTILLLFFLFTSCFQNDELKNTSYSNILMKAGNIELSGTCIYWYQESTQEIMFQQEPELIMEILPILFSHEKIAIYLNDEFLFYIYSSSVMSSSWGPNGRIYMDDYGSEYYLRPTFTEQTIVTGGMEKYQELSEQEVNWNRFINQLKAEGRYKK